MKIPSPNKRLCKKHNRPICPSVWLKGSRNVGCGRCAYEKKSPERIRRDNLLAKISRRKRWDSGERPCCKNHPTVEVGRVWIATGRRYCYPCLGQRLKRFPRAYANHQVRARERYRAIMNDPKMHKRELVRMKKWKIETGYRAGA